MEITRIDIYNSSRAEKISLKEVTSFNLTAEYNDHAKAYIKAKCSTSKFNSFIKKASSFKYIDVEFANDSQYKLPAGEVSDKILGSLDSSVPNLLNQSTGRLFFGVCNDIKAVPAKDEPNMYDITIVAYSLSVLLDLKYSFAAFNYKTTLAIVCKMMQRATDIFVYGGENLIDEKFIKNCDDFYHQNEKFFLCYKETTFEFLKRYASYMYGSLAPLFSDTKVKLLLVNPFMVSATTSMELHDVNVINTLYRVNNDLYKHTIYDNKLMHKGYKFEYNNQLLHLGQVICFKKPKNPSKKTSDMAITKLSIRMTQDKKLVCIYECIGKDGVCKMPYTNPKIHGLTLLGCVMNVKDDGVVVSFGRKYQQVDAISDMQVKNDGTFKEMQKNRFKKFHKYAAYLMGNYTNDDSVYKQVLNDPIKYLFGDKHRKKYLDVSKCFALNTIKVDSKDIYNLEDWVSPNMISFPVKGVCVANSATEGLTENVDMSEVVKVFFTSEDESSATVFPVPDLFEDNIRNEYKYLLDSVADVPDPYNDINNPVSSVESPPIPSDSSSKTNMVPNSDKLNKGDPKNENLKEYMDLRTLYESADDYDNVSKDTSIIDKRGGYAGFKISDLKLAMIDQAKNDDNMDVDYCSMFIDSNPSNALLISKKGVSINAREKIIIKAKHVVFVSEGKTSFSSASSTLSLDKEELSYTAPIKNFDSN